MISDILSDAAADLDGYLADPTFSTTYTTDLRERVHRLRREMLAIANELDTPAVEARKRAGAQQRELDPAMQHLVRWLAPFVERNAEDFARTWSYVASDAVGKMTNAGTRDDAIIAAYDVVCAIRAQAGIRDA